MILKFIHAIICVLLYFFLFSLLEYFGDQLVFTALKKSRSIIASIFFMIFFGGIALFQYIAFAPKLYVYGNKIVIKKWYGLRRKYYVQDIDKVIFEKSEGKIVTIQIISSISKDKYIDTVENFDKLLNYLLKKVEKEKMECYILGTKEEAEI